MIPTLHHHMRQSLPIYNHGSCHEIINKNAQYRTYNMNKYSKPIQCSRCDYCVLFEQLSAVQVGSCTTAG